jgi:hypothetical protein
VVRQGGEHRPAVALRAAGLERLRDAKVDLGLARRRQPVRHRAPHELVREAVRETAARLLHEQPVSDGLVHGLEQDRLQDDLGPANGVQLEVGARDRGEREHLVRLGREPRESLVDDLPHGRRGPELRRRPREQRPSRPDLDCARVEQLAPELGHEERVAACQVGDRGTQLGRRFDPGRESHELGDLGLRQPAQADPALHLVRYTSTSVSAPPASASASRVAEQHRAAAPGRVA